MLPKAVVAAALLVSGCGTLFIEQLIADSRFTADQVAAAAAACTNPEIQQQAADVAAAAERMRTNQGYYDQSMAEVNSRRDEAARLRHEADALEYRARTGHSRRLDVAARRDAALDACRDTDNACRGNAECLRTLDFPSCQRFAALSDELGSLPTESEVRGMQEDVARFRSEADELDKIAENYMGAARNQADGVQRDANYIAENAPALQERIFEECTGTADAGPNPAPAALGGYNQDIFGAQNLGMPNTNLGACPVGSPMHTSCLAIQFMCNASCTPGGGSCSPGAPAGCLACYAAGCI